MSWVMHQVEIIRVGERLWLLDCTPTWRVRALPSRHLGFWTELFFVCATIWYLKLIDANRYLDISSAYLFLLYPLKILQFEQRDLTLTWDWTLHWRPKLYRKSLCQGLQNLTLARQRSQIAACHALYDVVFGALGRQIDDGKSSMWIVSLCELCALNMYKRLVHWRWRLCQHVPSVLNPVRFRWLNRFRQYNNGEVWFAHTWPPVSGVISLPFLLCGFWALFTAWMLTRWQRSDKNCRSF